MAEKSTTTVSAYSLEIGQTVMLKNRPAALVNSKILGDNITLYGRDVLTDKMVKDVVTSSTEMQVPHVEKQQYQLLAFDFNDRQFSLKNVTSGEVRDDIAVPERNSPSVLTQMKSDLQNGKKIILTVLTFGSESGVNPSDLLEDSQNDEYESGDE